MSWKASSSPRSMSRLMSPSSMADLAGDVRAGMVRFALVNGMGNALRHGGEWGLVGGRVEDHERVSSEGDVFQDGHWSGGGWVEARREVKVEY